MGNTSNWEFAAVVAAVVMGLGGLLLFSLIGTIGSWRVFRLASQSAREAEAASTAVQDLARQLAAKEAMAPGAQLAAAAADVGELRRQASALLDEQSRLNDATRNLVEARVLGGEDASRQLQELDAAVRRLEDNLGRVAAAVARLGPRPT
ncbi:MAG: hypothetical protein KGK07_11955 [Chloroflexota bacterium]|nr:hypothetical protein [Chloroflexota bacterium]